MLRVTPMGEETNLSERILAALTEVIETKKGTVLDHVVALVGT